MLMVFLLVVLLLLRFLLVFQIEMYDFNNNNACADNLNPLFSFQNRSFFTALTTKTTTTTLLLPLLGLGRSAIF